MKKLKEEGEIDARLFEWANMLRLAGNDAAHSVDRRISRDDAEDILAFTEAIVDYVYVYRTRFERYKAREIERTAASGDASP